VIKVDWSKVELALEKKKKMLEGEVLMARRELQNLTLKLGVIDGSGLQSHALPISLPPPVNLNVKKNESMGN
jgi:hypothetical protein